MAEETEKPAEGAPMTAQESAEHLTRMQRQLGYDSIFLDRGLSIVRPGEISPRGSHLVVEGASKGYVTIRVYYGSVAENEDALASALALSAEEENRAEGRGPDPSAPEQEAASALINSTLAEVDAVIERMSQGREEFERLKEETRSNISEIQRMMAA
jgi:hypothetical protein